MKKSASGMYGHLEQVDLGPSDYTIYPEYVLGLIWPRSFPQYFDREDKMDEMRKCVAAKGSSLPWQ